jgi:hypothetical protein
MLLVTMTQRRRFLPFLLLVGIGVLLVAVAGVLLMTKQDNSAAALPNPNGYDDLLQAAKAVSKIDTSGLDQEALRSLVASNAEALKLLRLGLSRRCAMSTEAVIGNFSNAGRELTGWRYLAKLLASEGQLAELENRPIDAAQSYADAIQLGIEMSRGGLFIHRLVGIACEAIGRIPLAKLLPRLTCEQARPLIKRLERIDETSVTWDEISRNERRFTFRELAKYRNPVTLVTAVRQIRLLFQDVQRGHDMAAAHLRLVTTELALRCYLAQHGTSPDRLEMLVPEYLSSTPMDPFSVRGFIYKPQATNWILYSIGPDKVDDGGKPIGADNNLIGVSQSGGRNRSGDLLYDSRW